MVTALCLAPDTPIRTLHEGIVVSFQDTEDGYPIPIEIWDNTTPGQKMAAQQNRFPRLARRMGHESYLFDDRRLKVCLLPIKLFLSVLTTLR